MFAFEQQGPQNCLFAASSTVKFFLQLLFTQERWNHQSQRSHLICEMDHEYTIHVKPCNASLPNGLHHLHQYCTSRMPDNNFEVTLRIAYMHASLFLYWWWGDTIPDASSNSIAIFCLITFKLFIAIGRGFSFTMHSANFIMRMNFACRWNNSANTVPSWQTLHTNHHLFANSGA